MPSRVGSRLVAAGRPLARKRLESPSSLGNTSLPTPASRVNPASFRSPELQLRVKADDKPTWRMTHFRLPMVARHDVTQKAPLQCGTKPLGPHYRVTCDDHFFPP